MLRKRDPYLEESLRQEFLLCDHSFWQRMEKEPPQEQNKNQPPVPQENPQMDSDQQENAGEKTSDATPLGKTDPKEDEWKEHAKRIESDMETYAKDAAADAGKLAWMLKLRSGSPAVMSAMGSILTNKYAEGYPGKRYYGGCECVDVVEELARERAKKLFGCEYVNVQPHSGAQANMAVQFAILKPGDTIMGMNLDHGGHLTHGSPVNFSGTYFHVVPYGVNDEGFIDYDKVREIALECKPKMIIAGASAYARTIDFKKFREIADEVNAVLMVDMAHIAGLVAAGLHPSPVPYADVVTTTTHKTLRGPRGGMILCSDEVNKKYNFNKAIFPGTQGEDSFIEIILFVYLITAEDHSSTS